MGFAVAEIHDGRAEAALSLVLANRVRNADIDARGFIYTTVFGSTTETGQVIRKLNPFSTDVLRRNVYGAEEDVDVVFAGKISTQRLPVGRTR